MSDFEDSLLAALETSQVMVNRISTAPIYEEPGGADSFELSELVDQSESALGHVASSKNLGMRRNRVTIPLARRAERPKEVGTKEDVVEGNESEASTSSGYASGLLAPLGCSSNTGKDQGCDPAPSKTTAEEDSTPLSPTITRSGGVKRPFVSAKELHLASTSTSPDPDGVVDKRKRKSLKDRMLETVQQNSPLALNGSPNLFSSPISSTHRRRTVTGGRELDLSSIAPPNSDQISSPSPPLETFYGMPGRVKEMFLEYRGIDTLFDWQTECLAHESLKKGTNFILSLPTSGGKTLVAEILMLQQVLLCGRDALLILPFVSIVREKIKSLTPFGLELGFLVEEYAGHKGRLPPIKRRQKQSVYVATIERGLTLVNSLVEEKRLNELGLVVVDELHMLGEGGSRGSALEQTVCKLLLSAPDCQLVGMSATLSNIEELKLFLHAELFTSNFRPVELVEFVKLDRKVYKFNPLAQDEATLLNFHRNVLGKVDKADPDQLFPLVREVTDVGGSCLVFCPTKKNAENVAMLLANFCDKQSIEHRREQKERLYELLASEHDGNLCPILMKSMKYGIAYHHSGLTGDERKLIQDAYLDGTLNVLCCTSTLAAGVNLPAKRVILRSPMVGKDFLTRQQYKQMSGRAGRAGLDTHGESIVIIQHAHKENICGLLWSEFEECRSSLMKEGGRGFKILILSLIGLELIDNVDSLARILQGTLLWVQQDRLGINVLADMKVFLQDLIDNGLVAIVDQEGRSVEQLPGTMVDGEHRMVATTLGKAAYKGGVDVRVAAKLHQDLRMTLDMLVLSTHLHLLCCVVPYESVEDIMPDWTCLYDEYVRLPPSDKKVFEVLGISEFVLMQKMNGQSVKKGPSDLLLKRVYLGVVLYRLWQQESLWSVAQRFKLPRGHLQGLLQSASAFASSVARFVEVN